MSNLGGKRAGKVEWVDVRRPPTRRAGPDFIAKAPVQYRRTQVQSIILAPGSRVRIEADLPPVPAGTILGFGGWIYVGGSIREPRLATPATKTSVHIFPSPDWGKFGTQWYSVKPEAATVSFEIEAIGPVEVAFAGLGAGVVSHPYLDGARPELMTNMHDYAPEANFLTGPVIVDVKVIGPSTPGEGVTLTSKSCNRCGRFLPINTSNERAQLSFSNHCVAVRRRPCSHSGFGKIKGEKGGAVLELDFGYQLECRFCKKFEVNDAHNKQRSAAQMKEDGARRRGFELLLADLFGGSDSLLYRRATKGRELADDVYERFDGRCFKCGVALGRKEMRLDHTRPLALLWPLDGTATALCATHNSEKRDRPPAEYYRLDELERLAKITGLSLAEVRDPSPNRAALDLLMARLDWFYDGFLQREEMQEVHDGKLEADLLVKALRKVFAHAGLEGKLERPARAGKAGP